VEKFCDKFCDKFLSKLTFLDLQTDQKISEFSSRVGWSIAFLFIVHEIFGDAYVVAGASLWVVYSVARETRTEGRIPRLFFFEDKTEEFKGLITELASKCTAPVIVIFLRLFFR
jgi:hypothetical protein